MQQRFSCIGLQEKTIYMKQIFTLFSIIYFIPLISDAQFETGQKVIGGNLSFNASKSSNDTVYKVTNTGIGLQLSKAKFVKPNLLAGIGISYGYSVNLNKNSSPLNSYNYKNQSHYAGSYLR